MGRRRRLVRGWVENNFSRGRPAEGQAGALESRPYRSGELVVAVLVDPEAMVGEDVVGLLAAQPPHARQHEVVDADGLNRHPVQLRHGPRPEVVVERRLPANLIDRLLAVPPEPDIVDDGRELGAPTVRAVLRGRSWLAEV